VKVPEWILVLGGAGIVTGLAIYGYKIMRVLGVKSVKVTNARGFCLELSTAITVVVASRYGARRCFPMLRSSSRVMACRSVVAGQERPSGCL
jgi:hypothetical protein